MRIGCVFDAADAGDRGDHSTHDHVQIISREPPDEQSDKQPRIREDALEENCEAALLRAGSADRVLARVPLIPDYNTEGDVQKSVEALRAMGVTRVDPFRYLRKEA